MCELRRVVPLSLLGLFLITTSGCTDSPERKTG